MQACTYKFLPAHVHHFFCMILHAPGALACPRAPCARNRFCVHTRSAGFWCDSACTGFFMHAFSRGSGVHACTRRFLFSMCVHQWILHTQVHQGMGTSQLPKEGFSMHMCTRGLDKHVCTGRQGHPNFPARGFCLCMCTRAFCTHQNFAQTRAPRVGDVVTPVGGFCMQEGFACMKGFLHACTEGFVHACMLAPRVVFFMDPWMH